MKVVYLKAEEDLIDFLDRCRCKGSQVMLCPKCSAIFDKEAAKGVEMFQPQTKRNGKWVDRKPNFNFHKRDISHRAEASKRPPNKDQVKTFTPPLKVHVNKWIFYGGKQCGYSAQNSAQSTKWVQKGPSATSQNRASGSNKYA